ncbi:MAG: hypothetical protein LBV40_05655 [Methanomicrobiales archaeon]|jgi:hypothetical protein|nr:hypothetical protein [Methanomicrobiales archaeon]
MRAEEMIHFSSYLNSDADFDAAFEELITHVQTRYDAAMEYLKTGKNA